MADVDPRWKPVAAKLSKAADELLNAMAAHKAAVGDPKADRNAADATLMAAVEHAELLVRDVADTPPGTFPAVTG